MPDPHIYDKMAWHEETVEKCGLDEEHAAHHIAYFFQWLLDRDMLSDLFKADNEEDLAAYRKGSLTALELLLVYEGCLDSDMLSDQANAFARTYYGPGHNYFPDFASATMGNHPSEYHAPYAQDNYKRIASLIDKRYENWKRTRS